MHCTPSAKTVVWTGNFSFLPYKSDSYRAAAQVRLCKVKFRFLDLEAHNTPSLRAHSGWQIRQSPPKAMVVVLRSSLPPFISALTPAFTLALLLLQAACGAPPPIGRSNSPQTAPAPAAADTRSANRSPEKPRWQARKVVPNAREVNGVRIHTVKSGETGIAIARAYGVPWPELATTNNLSPPFVLQVGDRLRLPSRQTVDARPVEERAKAFNLDVDTLITGSEPAQKAPPARAAAKPPAAAPTNTGAPPTRVASAPADALTFLWPVDGRILSGFGPKTAGRFNDGINLKASAGTPVRAAASGTVAYAGDAITGFGNLVLIRHDKGWVTAYGHNEALLVERGQKVRAGDPIARAGSTGSVTEPQLHFEIRRGRTALDPQSLLPKRSG
jgi:murein DD-endopeptidase MepM/ murein hydrolase activator NlpD